MRVASSSGDHGPFLTLALSQHGDLPMANLIKHTTAVDYSYQLSSMYIVGVEKERERESARESLRKTVGIQYKTI